MSYDAGCLCVSKQKRWPERDLTLKKNSKRRKFETVNWVETDIKSILSSVLCSLLSLIKCNYEINLSRHLRCSGQILDIIIMIIDPSREFDWQVIWPIITPNLPFCPTNKPNRRVEFKLEKWCVLMSFRELKQDFLWCSFMFISFYDYSKEEEMIGWYAVWAEAQHI